MTWERWRSATWMLAAAALVAIGIGLMHVAYTQPDSFVFAVAGVTLIACGGMIVGIGWLERR